MKNLNSYTDKPLSALFDKYGAFFAFSDSQLKAAMNPELKLKDYCSLGAGLICPKEHSKAVLEGMNEIHAQGIAQDIKENGMDAIIRRELYNYESFYTMDFEDAMDALKEYNFPKEDIIRVFHHELKTADFD